MTWFTLQQGNPYERECVRSNLNGISNLSLDVQEAIVTAWVTSWRSSTFDEIDDIPFSPACADYSLITHVNDVIRIGETLAVSARELWKENHDPHELYCILALHDIDKPLLYGREGEKVIRTEICRQVPHGVLGGFLLRELGFSDLVVSVVTTHADSMPFHGRGVEAYILKYADMFAADHAVIKAGLEPIYNRRT